MIKNLTPKKNPENPWQKLWRSKFINFFIAASSSFHPLHFSWQKNAIWRIPGEKKNCLRFFYVFDVVVSIFRWFYHLGGFHIQVALSFKRCKGSTKKMLQRRRRLRAVWFSAKHFFFSPMGKVQSQNSLSIYNTAYGETSKST